MKFVRVLMRLVSVDALKLKVDFACILCQKQNKFSAIELEKKN